MIRQILNPLSGQFDQVGTAFLADLPTIATSRILGRVTAGSGAPEELTIAQVLALGGLATSITAGKTLTLASADTYTLTAEATGVIALLNRSGGQTFTTAQKINVNSTAALFVEQDGVKDNVFLVDTTNGRVGIGGAPETSLSVWGDSAGSGMGVAWGYKTGGTIDLVPGNPSNGVCQINASFWSGTAPSLVLSTYSNANQLYLKNDGKLGVYVTSPLTRLHIRDVAAGTNAIRDILRIEAAVSGTGAGGAAGLGAGMTFNAETATDGTYQTQAQISALWTEATNATRKADLILSAYDTAEREGLRIKANGSVALLYLGGNTYLQADSRKLYFGAGDDMSAYYDGTSGYIKTDEVAASDLHITCGTAKTLVLDTPVTTDMQWEISSGRVGVANFPDWRTLTTNTADYAFDVDDYIDLNAEEVPHSWVEGGTVDIHLHVATDAANSSGASRYAKFTVYIAYSEAGTAWAETSFTAELEIPDGTAANTPFYLDMGNLDLTGFSIGAHVKPRVKRIAATGGTEYADHIFIHQAGGHVLNDTLGSRQEGTK